MTFSQFLPNLRTSNLCDIWPAKRGMELDGYVLKSYTNSKRQDQPATSRLLAYFYPSQTLALQVDSSKDGLGAVLLQNGKPSNLHPARSQLGSTQRPQLFRVHSKKKLASSSKTFTSFGHAVTQIWYSVPLHSRTQLRVGWPLIRDFPTQRNSQEHCVHAMNSGALPDIPDQRLQEIRHGTGINEEARQLLQTIRNEWPPRRDHLPPCVRPYVSFRDTLSPVPD